MRLRVWLLAVSLLFITGCASFAPVRRAQVSPGFSVDLKFGYTSPLSEEAYWFFDVGSDCPLCFSKPVAVSELALRYGVKRPGARGIQFGLIANGLAPQLEIFAEMQQQPDWNLGGGLRLGLPLIGSWATYQLFAIYERRLNEKHTLLYTPGIFLHAGHSPNRMNSGTLFLLSQALGLEIDSGPFTLAPAVSLSIGHASVNLSYSKPSSSMVFILDGSISLSLHQRNAK